MKISESPLLPIKVVFPSNVDYRTPDGGGGSTTIFGEVTPELRQSFISQLSEVRNYFAPALASMPNIPVVAKVTLKSEALAKSHRPTELFNEDTCPIIGANKLGELYISVEPAGLERTQQKIGHTTQKILANLSAIESITPFTDSDALQTIGELEEDIFSTDDEIVAPAIRLRLFKYRNELQNQRVEAAFQRVAQESDVTIEEMHYAEGLKVFKVKSASRKAMARLAGFPGTQSIGPFPKYRLVKKESNLQSRLTAKDFPHPDPNRDYGLVGIIDSGTDPYNRLLQRWVVGRLDLVPAEIQDNDHGSFVAGLIANGHNLNHNDPRFPKASCKIVDVVLFDKTGEANEDDILFALDKAVENFPEVQVWNLSLSLDGLPCTNDEFSMLGTALDERTQKYGVLFVVAAGNINDEYRGWPAEERDDEIERICPPADSLCALTVGARAHLDTPSSLVRANDPSPFTRRGPGPGYTMKPEVSHWGGNCNADGLYHQVGVLSLDGSGHLVENVGTSFATPLVSAIAGDTFHLLDSGPAADRPTPALVKALTVHSAFVRNAKLQNPIVTHFMGVGIPADSNEIIGCTQSAATLILKIPVTSGPNFYKDPFPMPASLYVPEKNALQGEIFMTLLYEPPMDRDFGVEYCRLNVAASLGTFREKNGVEVYGREVDPYPQWKPDEAVREKELLEHGYKWSPLKFYYRKLSRFDPTLRWRLSLDQLNRSEFVTETDQEVTLILTIRASNPEAKVYDELVASMAKLKWITDDLAVRTQTRIRL